MIAPRHEQGILGHYARQFRILNGWKVRLVDMPQNHGVSWGGWKSNSFSVGTWDTKTMGPMPGDYLIHEVLHGVLTALVKMDKRKSKEQRQAMEGVVRDLCRLLCPEVKKRTR